MDLTLFTTAASLVFSGECIMWMFLGSLLGVFLGAIPGISSGMAVALLLPLTYTIGPLNSVVFLTCIFVGVGYGGSLTAILLNAPGSPENSATTLDGYALTRQGRAGEALGYSNMSSLVGGTVSYLMLLFTVGWLARTALKFGPSELFIISLMGVFILGAIGSGSVLKTFTSGLVGLLIGTIGLVPTGEWRATFDSIYLVEGVQVIPVMIGIFVISEILIFMKAGFVTGTAEGDLSNFQQIMRGMRKTFDYPWTLVRGSVIGCIIGIIPAAGATLASFAAYTWEKATARDPASFGKGRAEGIIAAEGANNACYGGSLMTTLALGIPGSVTTAILLSALSMHGVQPGPRMLISQGPLVYGLIFSAIVSQFFMAFLAMACGTFFTRLLSIRAYVLLPMLLTISLVGAYSLRNAYFDVWMMLGCGLIGWWMKSAGYSPAAFVMGIVLGPIADNELVRMVQLYDRDWPIMMVSRPLSLGLIGIFALGMSYILFVKYRNHRNSLQAAE